eukprot:CAMPEP_0185429552 /NCGR_PEP_ID=MMETSP1365-20130426/16841_1 /TAXON_ID=38817 /ORGANISM="Gephyrocapsa oceanica, Strain RCC1303" /LENGTH=270 /DNA_ID=CAMNT_0028033787 /DNA_START=501 /DNA_END=1314 /DNA_ORIENTATION=+
MPAGTTRALSTGQKTKSLQKSLSGLRAQKDQESSIHTLCALETTGNARLHLTLEWLGPTTEPEPVHACIRVVCAYYISPQIAPLLLPRLSLSVLDYCRTPLCLCPRLPHFSLASKDRPALRVLRPASVLDVGEAVRLQVFLRLLAAAAAAAVRDDRGRLVLAVQRREVHRRGGTVEDDVDRSLAARVSDLCGLVCLAVARLLLKVRVADVDNDQIIARLLDKAGQLLRRAHTRFAAHDGKGAGERRVRRGGAGERSGERSAGTEGWEEHG